MLSGTKNMNTILISDQVESETAKTIEGGLDAFNEMHNGPDPTLPLWIVCRGDDGSVYAGLQGFIQWDWLVVSILWVKEDNRGQGIGRRLLSEAETTARNRGCTRSRLATMTFQAPEFYEKLGYVEIGRLPDFPPGHDYIWMTKFLPG